MDFQRIRDTTETAARTVGERMRQALKGNMAFEVKDKGRNDLVTEIDLWAEGHLSTVLKQEFPDYEFLGEETSLAMSKARGTPLRELASTGTWWIVDPLDGTSNFVNHIPHCAVSVGLLVEGVRTFGLVYDPAREELFTAVKGQAAECNGVPIHVSSKTRLIDAVVGTGFPHDNQDRWELYKHVHDAAVRKFRKVRVLGSAALEQCWVACGRLDGFLEYGIKAWDMAAGSLIVEEAGGNVGCFVQRSSPFSIFGESIVVAAPGVFPEMISVAHMADREARGQLGQT